MAQITKKGARQVTADLDKLATLFQDQWEALGIPQKIAKDFAYRCDMLSDAIEKRAGFDPSQIGEETSGPQEGDSDESYMNQQFSQQENRELRERQEGGDLGATPNPEEQTPTPGVQASAKALGDALKQAKLNAQAQAKVAKALELATRLVQAAEEEEEEEEEEVEEEKEAKKSAYDLFA